VGAVVWVVVGNAVVEVVVEAVPPPAKPGRWVVVVTLRAVVVDAGTLPETPWKALVLGTR
jgi:hypothetical protein